MDSIVLASTSKYRASQMRQLAIPFQQMTPSFDEEIFKGKGYSPLALARLLAAGKAKSLSHLGCTVIAADQLVSFEGEILGKPGCRAKAIETLQRMAGREHELITALCVLYKGTEITHEVITRIQLHPLSLEQIENYVDLDEPLDCAGSYKIESHGISLMARIETEDFSAIQGLPLLALGKILRSCGYVFPQGGLK